MLCTVISAKQQQKVTARYLFNSISVIAKVVQAAPIPTHLNAVLIINYGHTSRIQLNKPCQNLDTYRFLLLLYTASPRKPVETNTS